MRAISAAPLRLATAHARRLGALLLAAATMSGAADALAQAPPAADPREAQASDCLSRSSYEPRAALALSERLLASGAMPAGVEVRLLVCRAQALQVTGQGEEALRMVDRLLVRLDAANVSPPLRMRGRLGAIGVLLGASRLERAMALMRSVLEDSRSRGETTATIDALLAVAIVHATQLDDQEGAVRYYDEALALSGRLRQGATKQEMTMRYNRAYSLLLLGRHAEAEAGFATVMKMAGELSGQEGMVSRIASHRGEILRASGRMEEALASLRRAEAEQQRLGDALGRTVTLRRLARIDLDGGDPQAALAKAGQALDLVLQGHFVPELRNTLELMVEVHAALGQAQAAARYREMIEASRPGADQTAVLERLARLRNEIDTELAGDRASYQDLGEARLTRDLALGALALALAACAGLFWRARRTKRRLPASPREVG